MLLGKCNFCAKIGLRAKIDRGGALQESPPTPVKPSQIHMRLIRVNVYVLGYSTFVKVSKKKYANKRFLLRRFLVFFSVPNVF